VPREKIVRGDRVANAIKESNRPFVTTSDIAEHLDVTTQAVRDNANDLAEHPMLKKDLVGQNSVYWLANESASNKNGEDAEKSGGIIRGLLSNE